MKSFNEFETGEEILQENLLRKGAALLLARNAKKHGDDAVRHFKEAQRKLSVRGTNTPETHIESILEGLNDLCEGMISLREQNGALTGISTTAVLLNERTSKQIYKLIRKRK